MKCTIITIYDPNPNYGNRLQNYAVQKVLQGMGLDVQTVSFEQGILTPKKLLKYKLHKMIPYRILGDENYWGKFIPKVIEFDKFNKNYINTRHISNIDEIKKIKTDYFVLGSDQVWNPEWYKNNSLKQYIFLLTFAEDKQKVCFSPSFSINELPKEWEKWFEKYLSLFPRISIREEAGAQIVKKLTGKEAIVLIDPTMMLDSLDWMKIAKKPRNVNCNKPYVLTYFIGGRSNRVNTDLKKYAEENNMEIYNLMDYAQPDLFVAGPSEFIYLIAHSQLVMTDSFHACVFSFLFQKPFLVYDRKGKENNMMSRMDTLLEKFDLKRKYVDSELINEILECDYSIGFKQLQFERQKAESFLRNSLNLDK